VSRRLPSKPPVLPGFSFVHVLGSGGFADVFLFEQNMPRRQVAVKILLSEVVNEHVRQMFQAEANLMAQLSSHPSILTVYEAGVSSDGRPYLVMELCSSALAERYRTERLAVPEVLRIAIRIGSAIETAHRAGVLHRDIKPSNILMTAYGHPVLSDFGIASTLTADQGEEAVGLSIPWSAPEVLSDQTAGTVASEIWSFAATVYSFLAGRSPFEVAGQQNTSQELLGRIGKSKPQPIDRPDVPASLEDLLRRAMVRRPDQRPATVMEMLRELQLVETELGLPQTPIEVAVDEWALGSSSPLSERTRVRPVADPSAAGNRARRRAAAGRETYAPTGVLADPSSDRLSRGSSRTDAPPAPTRSARPLAIVLAVSLGVVVVLGAVAVVLGFQAGRTSDIPRVVDIAAVRESNGSVRFSWSDPGLQQGDRYQVKVGDDAPIVQRRASFTVDDAAAGDRVCLTVTVNRDGRTGEESLQKCLAAEGS
jgi:eukaryotic-like serine/threonine-protein kinase